MRNAGRLVTVRFKRATPRTRVLFVKGNVAGDVLSKRLRRGAGITASAGAGCAGKREIPGGLDVKAREGDVRGRWLRGNGDGSGE